MAGGPRRRTGVRARKTKSMQLLITVTHIIRKVQWRRVKWYVKVSSGVVQEKRATYGVSIVKLSKRDFQVE